MRSAADRPTCPPGDDLTAYAHGEGDASSRARLARHLLACPACHAACDADAALLLELQALGAARSVPPPPVPRLLRPRWPAWLPPVAAALLVGLALLLPSPEPAHPPARTTPVGLKSAAPRAAHLAQLLGSQAADGHWAAEQGPLNAEPATATALVLLALLHERDAAQGALDQDASLAWALEHGTRWLVERLERPDRSLHALEAAPRAVLLAALARTARRAPSPRLDALNRTLVADLGGRLAQGPHDAGTRTWVDYALAASEEADVLGAVEARGVWAGALGEVAASARAGTRQPTPPTPPGVVTPCTPVRAALEVLRDEPPLRMLALGPACRPPERLALR